jgi:glyoxalase family protein
MKKLITGIHHVTALADDPQLNLDFYCGILGVRMVKRTVNFDAPEVYHFYYGDAKGLPGSILTFFPYQGITRGRRGKGMLNTTAFSVPEGSLDFWTQRLKRFGIKSDKPKEYKGGETGVYFEDHDGMGLELVFNDKDQRPGFTYGHIPVEHSIKGFYRVEIWLNDLDNTSSLLMEQLNHQLLAEGAGYRRLAATDSPAHYVDLIANPNIPRGLGGGGTVHHIAFSTPTEETQIMARERIADAGFNPTPVIDRQYFKSIYFREPGGVLFEVATAGPGFLIDEREEQLGEALKLPSRYESRREIIEKAVSPIDFNILKYS